MLLPSGHFLNIDLFICKQWNYINFAESHLSSEEAEKKYQADSAFRPGRYLSNSTTSNPAVKHNSLVAKDYSSVAEDHSLVARNDNPLPWVTHVPYLHHQHHIR